MISWWLDSISWFISDTWDAREKRESSSEEDGHRGWEGQGVH